MKSAGRANQRQTTLLGLGLDNQDGQTRLTRGESFVLFGGSQDTHSAMQETVIKVNERLAKQGKRLQDVSPCELGDLLGDALR